MEDTFFIYRSHLEPSTNSSSNPPEAEFEREEKTFGVTTHFPSGRQLQGISTSSLVKRSIFAACASKVPQPGQRIDRGAGVQEASLSAILTLEEHPATRLTILHFTGATMDELRHHGKRPMAICKPHKWRACG
jgi:hypothetical protein